LAADGEGNGWDKKHPAISKYSFIIVLHD
jgi:hypothetical protein